MRTLCKFLCLVFILMFVVTSAHAGRGDACLRTADCDQGEHCVGNVCQQAQTPQPDCNLPPGRSLSCFYSVGPKKGQIEGFCGRANPAPIGAPCSDDQGSFGSAVGPVDHPKGTGSGGRPPGDFRPAPESPARRHAHTHEFHNLVPVRSYLRAAEIAPKNIAAYGVVAFRALPTPATRGRLRIACISYTKTLARQADLPNSVSPGDQMLTIWPLDDPTNAQAAADNCDFVIDHYDLYGGDSAIQDALRQGAKLGDAGPFLIGWSPSNTRGIHDKLVLVVDMSGLDSQESFDQAFLFWKMKVVEDPALWQSGFHSEELKLSVRDFVDHYGKAILAAVNLWQGKE